jgi:hypothetical protein
LPTIRDSKRCTAAAAFRIASAATALPPAPPASPRPPQLEPLAWGPKPLLGYSCPSPLECRAYRGRAGKRSDRLRTTLKSLRSAQTASRTTLKSLRSAQTASRTTLKSPAKRSDRLPNALCSRAEALGPPPNDFEVTPKRSDRFQSPTLRHPEALRPLPNPALRQRGALEPPPNRFSRPPESLRLLRSDFKVAWKRSECLPGSFLADEEVCAAANGWRGAGSCCETRVGTE